MLLFLQLEPAACSSERDFGETGAVSRHPATRPRPRLMSRHSRKEVAVGPQYEGALVPFLKVVKRPGSYADILDALRKFVEANEGTRYLSPGWRKFFLVSLS